jgi:type I restriction enzyme S subunit
MQAHMLSLAGAGATRNALTKGMIESFEVPAPRDVDEQRAIAHILGTLDDKIELNRRMNETLEAMARALFKSWFVDFDPVRAKMEGRDPGLPKPLADLFPARLVDSELGEIPEGWEVKPIGELAEVIGGSTPKTERPEYWEGGTHHWVTPKDLSGLSMPVLLDTERKITDAGLAQISSGLLPKGTVLLSSRAPIGYLAIAEVPVAVNQGFIAMKPRQGTSNLFLLRWASAAHEEIVSHANGSTFLEISKANFRPIRTVAPGGSVMEAFDRLARPLYRKVVANERESRTLAALRDTLLPKLISGELRVKDAEKFLDRVGTLTETSPIRSRP